MREKWMFALLLCATQALASEIIYTPVNPSFGGNPLNGSFLMNNAQAQDDNEPAGGSKDLRAEKSELEQFNELLQRAILNKIAASVTGTLVGASGELIPGIVETADFIIEIIDLGGGLLSVTTTDKVTGDSTTFQISN